MVSSHGFSVFVCCLLSVEVGFGQKCFGIFCETEDVSSRWTANGCNN